MSRSRTTLAITVLTVLTIALSARANYRDGSKAIMISGGEDHTLVVTANNWAWACGPNGYRYQDVTYYSCVLGIGSNDPYLKRNIQQFWNSWHMSLSNWIRDYFFIPFGKKLCQVFKDPAGHLLTITFINMAITM